MFPIPICILVDCGLCISFTFCFGVSGILFVYPLTDVVSFHFVRLNFDYDIRRGSEEGPWIDGSECFLIFLLII